MINSQAKQKVCPLMFIGLATLMNARANTAQVSGLPASQVEKSFDHYSAKDNKCRGGGA